MKPIYSILAIAAILVLAYGTGSIECNYSDARTAAGNTFAAFSSTAWTQTTQADFTAASRSNVDVNTVPGDVLLSKSGNRYVTSGNIRSVVLDTGKSGTVIDLLEWSASLPASTTITFYVRARDTSFSQTASSPAWTNVGTTSPVATGLPKGRYVQWRAVLATTNTARTPDLQEVRLWYH